MPSYSNNPFTPPQLLVRGVPLYLFGSQNLHQAPTRMLVSKVAIASNVATLTVQIVEGEVPKVGSFVSVTQTATASGAFNVNRVALASVTIDNNGAGTVTFPLTHADVTQANDAGTAVVDVPEVPETLANGASIPFCVQSQNQETITTAVMFPTAPTAVTVSLQEAVYNTDGEFTTIATAASYASSAYTAGPIGQFTLTAGNFYRFLTSGLSGSGSIVAKVF